MDSMITSGVAGFSRPQTTQQAVLAEMRDLITRGEIRPGAQLVQGTLAERFGVSRVPVREALKILEGEGWVTNTAHHGYTVTRLEVTDLLEVYRLRALLEREVVSEGVPLLEEKHLMQMRRAMDAMDEAADDQDLVNFGTHNRIFHFAVFEPSEMTRAIRMIHQLWDTTDPYRSLYFIKSLSRETANTEHAQILEACTARDADLVVHLLDVHRGHAVDDLRAMEHSWST